MWLILGLAVLKLTGVIIALRVKAKPGEQLELLDFLDISEGLKTRVTNRYILIGYDVPNSGTPITEGCDLICDPPNCSVLEVTVVF